MAMFLKAAQALALDTNANLRSGYATPASESVGATGWEKEALNKRNRTVEVVHQNEEEGGEQNRHESICSAVRPGFLTEGADSQTQR